MQHLQMECKTYFASRDPQVLTFLPISGHVMAQAVSCWPVTTEDWIQSQASLCGIFGRQSDNGTDFSLSTSVLPVSSIPPMLHPYSLMYH
jgi:hypothetical protein